MTEPTAAPGTADLFAKLSDPRVEQWELAEQLGMLPFFQTLDGEVGPRMTFGGRQVVMLGSNNYLGLTSDERVRKAAIDAVERYGTGLTGSRLLNGTLPIHAELEGFLADWVGMESALVFSTGYGANLGLVSSLVGPADAVFVDSAAHASLVDGGKFCEGTLRAFRHNRPKSLQRGLAGWRDQPDAGGVLVAVDGIYSMEGEQAPLADIDAIRREFGARLLVDEAHALGVVGAEGSGSADAAGIRPDLKMGTFSKSLASCGGFVAGPAEVVTFLKVTCRPLLFTAAGVPAALAAALSAAHIARDEDWRREAVLARATQLRAGLSGLGYTVGGDPGTPIVPVIIGDDWEAAKLWKALLANGVYTNCALAPAVPRATLRTSVMATHTEADIADALAGFAAAKEAVKQEG
ncbi:MAG TPA: pyridoxal phosphate-dependent aminotransferase family protein [Acidimicrobiales bacterium]|nr:pyridoxal phosphate-dependent aminotransferase family protein [Acidimicrobiales bacterium]